ncbi:MAG: hypothetical protein ACYC3I_14165 [Gemmataceae bacterium]
MRHRRLTRILLLLGACLPLAAGKVHGQRWDTPSAPVQREVIASSVAVTPQPPPAPQPLAPPKPLPLPPTPADPTPGAIQQASYVPDPPANGPAPQPPPPPMLSPNALHGIMSGAAMNARNPAESMAASLSVEVAGPDRIILGKPLTHEIVIRNTGTRRVAEAHVEEPLPAQVRVLSTDPPAVERDHRLVWDLRNLEAGCERRLKVELNPGRPGELDLRPYLTFLSGNGLLTQVILPPFNMEISADRTKATRGERIQFVIRLTNNGDAPIRNIKIYDPLPSGLHHPMGPKIGIEHFGDLLPGQTRTIPLEATAVDSGPFHNEVFAQAERGVEAKAAIDGIITEPSLSLRVDGPAQTVTRREVDFHLEVANPAALTAKQIRLVQALPPTFEVVSPSEGASLDNNLHALVWSLSDLGPGQRFAVRFRIKAHAAGAWPMCTSVLSQNFPEARVNSTLHAEAAAALKLEVRAREDRLAVNEETVFRMHIINQGDAPCAGLRLTATLPEAVTPFKAEGPSSEQLEQQVVRFAPLAQLDAHGDVVYRIHVRGRQAGRGTLRVQLTAENQAPADSEISIQVVAPSENVSADAATTGALKPASAETLR